MRVLRFSGYEVVAEDDDAGENGEDEGEPEQAVENGA